VFDIIVFIPQLFVLQERLLEGIDESVWADDYIDDESDLCFQNSTKSARECSFHVISMN
jgi:hypothetical protein